MITAYHGRPTRSPYFHRRFCGEGNDQEGPGFYFTTDKKQAYGYAGSTGCVVTAALRVESWVPVDRALAAGVVQAMVSRAPQEALAEYSEHWGGDWDEAQDSLLRCSEVEEAPAYLQTIWYDLYTPKRSAEFLRAVSAFYQGAQIKHPECMHYCIFDPDAIEVVKVEYAPGWVTLDPNDELRTAITQVYIDGEQNWDRGSGWPPDELEVEKQYNAVAWLTKFAKKWKMHKFTPLANKEEA